jgi:hypothetical protein
MQERAAVFTGVLRTQKSRRLPLVTAKRSEPQKSPDQRAAQRWLT